MRLKYCTIIKNFFLIIFLCLSFNSFAHNEDFNEKEKKLENELRDDKNWPPLLALYNLHGYEDFGCHNVLPYAKIIKKAGWCLDYDFKKYRDKAFKKQITETYGESAKKNYKDYYFLFESTTYPKNHKAYYPKSHITCSERFKEEFNGNLKKFLNHKDGLYKNVCPRFIKYQKRLDSGDEKLLSQLSFFETKFANDVAKRKEQLKEWEAEEETKDNLKRENDRKRILEDKVLVAGAEQIINLYTDKVIKILSEMNIDNFRDFDFNKKFSDAFGGFDEKGYYNVTIKYCEKNDIHVGVCNKHFDFVGLFPTTKAIEKEFKELYRTKLYKLNELDLERKANEKIVIIFNDYYQGFKNNYSNNKEGWCKGNSYNSLSYWGNCKNPKSNVEKWAEQKSKNKKKTKKCTLRVGGQHCYYE